MSALALRWRALLAPPAPPAPTYQAVLGLKLLAPRLNSTPVPLPAQLAQGPYVGAAALFDLDRIAELPFVEQDLQAPTLAAVATALALPAGWGRAADLNAARTRQFALLTAYCCAGLIGPDGAKLPRTDLDDIDGWATHPRLLLRWLYTKGTGWAVQEATAPFLLAAPDPVEMDSET